MATANRPRSIGEIGHVVLENDHDAFVNPAMDELSECPFVLPDRHGPELLAPRLRTHGVAEQAVGLREPGRVNAFETT